MTNQFQVYSDHAINVFHFIIFNLFPTTVKETELSILVDYVRNQWINPRNRPNIGAQRTPPATTSSTQTSINSDNKKRKIS